MSDPDRIAHFLLKPFARACKEFDLLAAADRVAVAVSGGKDSRTMLDLLLRYRRRVPFDYEVAAIHVVGTEAGLPDVTGTLVPWFEALGVDYHLVPIDLPENEPLPMDCFRCAWNRRKTLFQTAHGLGYPKLALGHHADDAAVTTLLNLLFSGRLETLEPRVEFFDGEITVIRPLIHTEAKELARYGRAAGFPPDPPCPFESDTNRQKIEAFLRSFGSQQGQIRANLWRTARGE